MGLTHNNEVRNCVKKKAETMGVSGESENTEDDEPTHQVCLSRKQSVLHR